MIQFRQRSKSDRTGPNRFAPGDLVRHRRYDYRGVIVDFDPVCKAAEEWYRANRTQPSRDQPWYHVLVGGGHHSTYAAEDSLVAEWEPAEIDHPLVPRFFTAFTGDHYLRNDQPWSSGGP